MTIAPCHRSDLAGVSASRLARMARGFNLTGWLDAVPPRRPVVALDTLRKLGFTHIRLPVDAQLLMPQYSPAAVVRRQWRRMDADIDFLLKTGFAVTLDVHPGGRFSKLHASAPEAAFEQLEELWRKLARRYRDRSPETLYFELLNEPAAPFDVWNAQAARLIAAIRRIAPRHTIIFGTASFQRIDALTTIQPLAERNIVYAVHFYDPFVFTHQGMDWDAGSPMRQLYGVPFPASLTKAHVPALLQKLERDGAGKAAAELRGALERPWDEARIRAEFARAAAWGALHRRPVIVNEFGVLKWNVSPADRSLWIRTVRLAAERHCIGWTHWEFADGFGFIDQSGLLPIVDLEMIRALLEPVR